ncbi:hypothetical protein D5086_001995 [Populus alba]|uniref:Uncharacterized protein n=1 Tax=Populus alba TaxID=43335 RepID=A0ACC4D1F6_POPAL
MNRSFVFNRRATTGAPQPHLPSAAVVEPAATSSSQQQQCSFQQLDFQSHHQQPTTAAPLNRLPLRPAYILFSASCHRE